MSSIDKKSFQDNFTQLHTFGDGVPHTSSGCRGNTPCVPWQRQRLMMLVDDSSWLVLCVFNHRVWRLAGAINWWLITPLSPLSRHGNGHTLPLYSHGDRDEATTPTHLGTWCWMSASLWGLPHYRPQACFCFLTFAQAEPGLQGV